MPSSVKSRVPSSLPVAFWDASALVPLCCWQKQTQTARQARRLFPQMVVWWATRVECISALRRLERAQALGSPEMQHALQELARLQQRWTEIAPLAGICATAERLLGQHSLRAADALQLAAALAWCNAYPQGKTFVCSDDRLLDAAANEGFTVIRL